MQVIGVEYFVPQISFHHFVKCVDSRSSGCTTASRTSPYPADWRLASSVRPSWSRTPILLHSLVSRRPLESFVCAAGGTTTGRLQVIYPSIHDCSPQLHVLQITSSNLIWRFILQGESTRSNRTSATDTTDAEWGFCRTFTCSRGWRTTRYMGTVVSHKRSAVLHSGTITADHHEIKSSDFGIACSAAMQLLQCPFAGSIGSEHV
jgi:hypothetical protein